MRHRYQCLALALIAAAFTACGTNQPVASGPNTAESQGANQVAWLVAPLTAPDRDDSDFDSVLAGFSEQYPSFAGYTMDTDGAITMRLVKHGGDLPGQRVGQIRKALLELLTTNSRVSVLYGDDGKPVAIKRVKPEFIEVKHNFADLYKGKIKARAELLRLGLASSSYINDADGMIVLSARNACALRVLRDHMSALGFPMDMVRFEIGEFRTQVSLEGTFTNPIGGIRITNTSNTPTSGCSIGVNVRFNGTANGLTNPQGFLTARHCTGVVGAFDNYVFNQGGSRIGKEALDPAPISRDTPGCAGNETGQSVQCFRSDVIFATYEVATNVGRIARPVESQGQKEVGVVNGVPNTYTVTSVAARPAVSSIVTKVGATTGWTKGRVVDDHIDIYLNDARVGQYVVLDTVEVGRLNPTDTYTISAGATVVLHGSSAMPRTSTILTLP
jgi:hypothetical protein